MRKKNSLVMLPISMAFILSAPAADPAGMALEQLELWIELEISYLKENTFQAGYPSQTVRSNLEISFRRAGAWTFARLKPAHGGGWRAFPGRPGRPEFPVVDKLAVTAGHPCQDGEGMLIGRRQVHPGARVHPALGEIWLESAPGGRVRVVLMPSQVDVDHLECPREYCNAGFFGGSLKIGENPAASREDRHGYQHVGGYELGVFAWDSFKALAGGGELPLALPLEAADELTENYQDPPGFPAAMTSTYRVRGTISTLQENRGTD